MHVPEIVMPVLYALAYFLEESVQSALLQEAMRDYAGLLEHLHGFLGCGMADDYIDLIIVLRQIAPRLSVFVIIGHFLRPPASPGDAAGHIDGITAAHGENGNSVDSEYLSAHKVQDVWTDVMNPATTPDFFRIGEYLRKAFVITIQEQDGIRQLC